jgi:hypothetical protein
MFLNLKISSQFPFRSVRSAPIGTHLKVSFVVSTSYCMCYLQSFVRKQACYFSWKLSNCIWKGSGSNFVFRLASVVTEVYRSSFHYLPTIADIIRAFKYVKPASKILIFLPFMNIFPIIRFYITCAVETASLQNL